MAESDPCGDCKHARRYHWALGEMDDVTPPEWRPSEPECEMCYVEKVSVEDRRFIHAFREVESGDGAARGPGTLG